MTTKEVADQLVALCRAGKNLEAVDTLLSADVVSVEATAEQGIPAVMTGREAVRGKNQWWVDNHVIHSAVVKGPLPNEDRFAVIFDFVVSPKVGPMAGRKMRMEEVAIYTVADGKVTREEFYYDMSGGGELPAEPPARKKAAKRTVSRKTAGKKPTKKPAKKPVAKVKSRVKAKSKAKTRTKARRR